MKIIRVLFLVLFASFALNAYPNPPAELDYQGKVLVNDVPYNGSGYFKFAVGNVGGTTNYWSNDGTTVGQPAGCITNSVFNGVFSTVLGAAPMSALNPDMFSNGNDLYLRVWFGTTNSTFNEMLPAQKLESSAYAINADQTDGMDASEIIAAATNGVTLSGDISGTPAAGTTVNSLQGDALNVGTPSSGDGLIWNGTAWSNAPGGISGTVASNSFVKIVGDTMTGALIINSPRGLKIGSASNDVEIGNLANGALSGVAVGGLANGTVYGAAVGGGAANANFYGAALGYGALATNAGVAVGWQSVGNGNGAAVGYGALAGDFGAAVGRGANGVTSGSALGYTANGYSHGVAVGNRANGRVSGVAMGEDAYGFSNGVAVGVLANGVSAVAVGYAANGYGQGAAVGESADATTHGAAVGYLANASQGGAAVGYNADANSSGVAVGEQSQGDNFGVAIGQNSDGRETNVAIGVQASAGSGSERIAIGHNVSNDRDNSARIRGTLYMDGGTALVARSIFGGGTWTTLVPLPPLENVVYVATNGTPMGPGTIDRPFDQPQFAYSYAAARYTNVPAAVVIAAGKYPSLFMNAGNIHILGHSRPQLAALTVNVPSAFILGKQRVENIVVEGVTTVTVDGGSDVKFHNCRFDGGLVIYGPRVEVQDCYAVGKDGPAVTVGNGASVIGEIAIYNSSMFNKDGANASLLVNPLVRYFEVIGCEIVNYPPTLGGLPWAAIEDREFQDLTPPQVPHLYSHNVIQGAEHGTWMGISRPAVFDPNVTNGPTITFLQNSVWGDVGMNSNRQFFANNTVYGDINNTGFGMTWGWGQFGLGTGQDAAGNTEHQGRFPGGGGSQRGFPAAWQD